MFGSSSSSVAGSNAFRRLMQEYKELTTNPPEGLVAGPVSEDNFFDWEAIIMCAAILSLLALAAFLTLFEMDRGPTGTPYENGFFKANLKFPPEYPLSPPKMVFSSEMWHPNIYPNGEVCISILHPPGDDPNMYESSDERWSPVQSVEKILLSVVSMLAEPNLESPANLDAAKMYRTNPDQFRRKVEDTVRKSLQ